MLILALVYAAGMLVLGVRISGSVAGFVAVAIAFSALSSTGAWVPAFLFPG